MDVYWKSMSLEKANDRVNKEAMGEGAAATRSMRNNVESIIKCMC